MLRANIYWKLLLLKETALWCKFHPAPSILGEYHLQCSVGDRHVVGFQFQLRHPAFLLVTTASCRRTTQHHTRSSSVILSVSHTFQQNQVAKCVIYCLTDVYNFVQKFIYIADISTKVAGVTFFILTLYTM